MSRQTMLGWLTAPHTVPRWWYALLVLALVVNTINDLIGL